MKWLIFWAIVFPQQSEPKTNNSCSNINPAIVTGRYWPVVSAENLTREQTEIEPGTKTNSGLSWYKDTVLWT